MLTPENVETVRAFLASSVWNDVLKPDLTERSETLKRYTWAPGARPKPYSEMEDRDATNLLRGQIQEVERLMTAYQAYVAAFDHNRRLDEREAQEGPPTGR